MIKFDNDVWSFLKFHIDAWSSRYDVTAVFKQMGLRPDSDYHFNVRITATDGTELDSSLLESPSVSFVPGNSMYNLSIFTNKGKIKFMSNE